MLTASLLIYWTVANANLLLLQAEVDQARTTTMYQYSSLLLEMLTAKHKDLP